MVSPLKSTRLQSKSVRADRMTSSSVRLKAASVTTLCRILVGTTMPRSTSKAAGRIGLWSGSATGPLCSRRLGIPKPLLPSSPGLSLKGVQTGRAAVATPG